MELQNQVPPNIEQAVEEYERCNYQLNTLFDFSKDIFGILEIEVILKNSLLFTMGNFGVVDGFIGLFDLTSGKNYCSAECCPGSAAKPVAPVSAGRNAIRYFRRQPVLR